MINFRIWVMNAYVKEWQKSGIFFPLFLQIPNTGGFKGEVPIRDQNHGV